jgi:hypothetical protein
MACTVGTDDIQKMMSGNVSGSANHQASRFTAGGTIGRDGAGFDMVDGRYTNSRTPTLRARPRGVHRAEVWVRLDEPNR